MLKKIKNNKSLFSIYLYIGFILFISFLNLLFLAKAITKYTIFIATIMFIFYLSYKFGHKRVSKGYISGIKTSLSTIIVMYLINLLFIKEDISIKILIYYLIIMLVGIFGSIIGINKKAN